MGLFTTIIYDNNEYQIKTGFDECETYRIGDRVPWEPDNYRPGDHIDGVYYSVGGPSNYLADGPWIIIKDCVIIAAEPRSGDGGDDLRRIESKYSIEEPRRDLWPEVAWKRKQERDERWQAEYEAFKRERNLSDEEAVVAYYVHTKLRETPVVEQLFPAAKVGR